MDLDPTEQNIFLDSLDIFTSLYTYRARGWPRRHLILKTLVRIMDGRRQQEAFIKADELAKLLTEKLPQLGTNESLKEYICYMVDKCPAVLYQEPDRRRQRTKK